MVIVATPPAADPAGAELGAWLRKRTLPIRLAAEVPAERGGRHAFHPGMLQFQFPGMPDVVRVEVLDVALDHDGAAGVEGDRKSVV